MRDDYMRSEPYSGPLSYGVAWDIASGASSSTVIGFMLIIDGREALGVTTTRERTARGSACVVTSWCMTTMRLTGETGWIPYDLT